MKRESSIIYLTLHDKVPECAIEIWIVTAWNRWPFIYTGLHSFILRTISGISFSFHLILARECYKIYVIVLTIFLSHLAHVRELFFHISLRFNSIAIHNPQNVLFSLFLLINLLKVLWNSLHTLFNSRVPRNKIKEEFSSFLFIISASRQYRAI
jgi:hypothetical protein